MNGLTRRQVFQWRPSALSDIATAWRSSASNMKQLFDRYLRAVDDVHGGPWQGKAADAARARADSDLTAARNLAEHLERAADIAVQGYRNISEPLQCAKQGILDAESFPYYCFVTDDLALIDAATGQPTVDPAAQQLEHSIRAAASAAAAEDQRVTTALNDTRNMLQQAFVAPGALSPEEATKDAAQLMADPSRLTGTQVQRLLEATSLTDQQLADLHSGKDIFIPASQFEYLTTLSRSFDSRSPQEIEAMLNRVSPDARRGFANALQVVSNSRVRASVLGDPGFTNDHVIQRNPVIAGVDHLPKKMRESLSRVDMTSYTRHGNGEVEELQLNGVPDIQATARISAMADPALRQDTGLNAKIMTAAIVMLDAQVYAETHDLPMIVEGHEEEYDGGDDVAVTEPMFAAVAVDKAQVDLAVNGEQGDRNMRNMFHHEWSDEGKAISGLFDFPQDHDVTAPGYYLPDELRYQIGDKVREFMDNRANEYSLPDDEGQSVYDVNPYLIESLRYKLDR